MAPLGRFRFEILNELEGESNRYYVKIVPEPPFKFGPYVIVAVVIVAVSFLVLIGSMVSIFCLCTAFHR